MEYSRLVCLRWIAEELPDHEMDMNECPDNNWFERHFLIYLQRLSIFQQVAFIEKELAISLEQFRSDLPKKSAVKLLNTIQLIQQEHSSLKISMREKWLAILSSFIVVGSSILGFSSGVIGIIVLADSDIITIMFSLIIFSFFPIIYLSKIGWEVLKKEERTTLAQMKLSKLHWEAAKFVCQKIEHDFNHRLLDVHVELNRIFPPLVTEHILAEFDDHQEDAFCTARGLAQLANKIEPILKNRSENDLTIIQELRRLSYELKHPVDVLNEKSNYSHVFMAAPYCLDAIDEEIRLEDKKSSLDTELTVKRWYKKNKKMLIKLIFPTFVGHTAGNFVFPGVLMMLGSKEAAIISSLHLRSLAEAMHTSTGLTITIAWVVAWGFMVALLTLYSQYKSYCRNEYLRDIQDKISMEKKIISLKQRKSGVLVEISNAFAKNFMVKLTHDLLLQKKMNPIEIAEFDKTELHKVIH